MKDLTKGNSTKLIIEFTIPVLIGNILQLLYSLIDTRIVGENLGNMSLAAVGATNPVNTLIVGFLLGLTNGFAIQVSRSFGAGNKDELRKSVAGTIKLGLIVSIILTIVSLVFLKPLLIALNTKEELLEESYAYISIIFAGMTASMLYNVCASILRAIGDTITPLVFLGMSTVLNIVGDLFFIKVVKLGVRGAAIATVIAQVISFVLCALYMWKKYEILRIKKSDFKVPQGMIKNMFKSGLSMGFMMSLVSLGTVALQGTINTFSNNTIVAHTAARKITELYMLLFGVLGTTMATFCSQNLGAGKVDRIKKALKGTILVSFVWSIGMMVLSYTVAPKLVYLVTATDEVEVIDIACKYLRIDTLFYFFPAMISIIRNAMQGIGDHITPIISSGIELVGKFLIATLLAPKIGYMGIIVAEPIVWVLMVLPLIVQIIRNPLLKKAKKI